MGWALGYTWGILGANNETYFEHSYLWLSLIYVCMCECVNVYTSLVSLYLYISVGLLIEC